MKRTLARGLLYLLSVTVPVCWAQQGEDGVATLDGPGTVPAAPDRSLPAADRLDFREIIRDAKGRVFPAVVFVKCLRDSHERGKRVSQEVSGSGVIISPTGELLTNWHVVDKATEVRCLLFDGRAMEARVLGTDKDTDLALLQLELPDDAAPVPYAPLGDSTVLVEGDFVMAMGAPWGLNRSVSIGIISCSNRFLPENGEYSLWLQTDAAISPGNSGGPLVNTDGQVIGINSLGALIGGDMGFAVPSETIRHVVPQLREFGRVNWSWTGLQLQPLKDFKRNIYFDGTEGVIVAETDPDSPARQAGIQPRDRLLKLNGQALKAITEEDLPAIRRQLGLLPKHRPAALEILRGTDTIAVELTPREKGDVEGQELDCPRWDLTVKAINQFDNPDLYFHRSRGVFIYGIKYPGNASSSGLSTRDIILKVDDREVSTLEEVREAHQASLENVQQKPRLLVTVLRGGLMRQVVLDISRVYERD
jgi:serine protease Do